MKKLFFFATLLLAGSLFSCSDDDVLDGATTDENSEPVGNFIDITDGMNVVILEGDDQINSGFKLGTQGSVEISNLNPAISYELNGRKGTIYIKPTIDSTNTQLILCDQLDLAINGNKKFDKKITLIYRRTASKNASHVDSGATPEITTRFMNILGKGFDIDMPKGTTESNVFSTDHIAIINDMLHGGLLSLQSTTQSDEIKMEEGRTYNSLTKSWSESVGINFITPFFWNCAFNFMGQETVSRNDHTESTREYALASHSAIKAQGSINELALTGFSHGGYLTGSSINQWSPIIAVELNNALNNPGSAEYKMYGNDEAGINKLISTYGGWFFTACQLGGSHNFMYSKNVDAEAHSMTWGLAIEMSVKEKESEATESDLLRRYIAQMIKSEAAKLSVEYKNHKEEIKEQMQIRSEEYAYGGNMDNNGKWEVSKDPSQWTIMAYGTPNDVDKVKRGEKNPHLHLLYELCVDQDSERAKALKKALDPDKDNVIPYLMYKKAYKEKDKGRMVLADVILIDRGYESNSNPSPGDDKVEFWKSPDGKWRNYYPLMINGNSGVGKWGFALNLEDYYWSGESTNRCRLYIYYALDWSSQCRGITNIRLGETPSPRTETVRGDHTDKGMKADAKNHSKFIIVEWAEKDTPLDSLITGFGMKYTDWDNENGAFKGKVFATTSGTEWDKESRFRSGDDYEKYFLKYWGDNQDYTKCEVHDRTVKGHENEYQDSFVDLKGQHRYHTAHMCYTKKPIEKDMTGYEGVDLGKAYSNFTKKSGIVLPWKYGEDTLIN